MHCPRRASDVERNTGGFGHFDVGKRMGRLKILRVWRLDWPGMLEVELSVPC
jgi:hypothetical protein